MFIEVVEMLRKRCSILEHSSSCSVIVESECMDGALESSIGVGLDNRGGNVEECRLLHVTGGCACSLLDRSESMAIFRVIEEVSGVISAFGDTIVSKIGRLMKLVKMHDTTCSSGRRQK